MTKELFIREVSRLTAAFPEGGMNDATLELWWEKFQVIPEKLFIRGIEKVINTREYKYLPTVAEILKHTIGHLHGIVPYRSRSNDQGQMLDRIMIELENRSKLRTVPKIALPSGSEADVLQQENAALKSKVNMAERRANVAEAALSEAEAKIKDLLSENKRQGDALAVLEKLSRSNKCLQNERQVR